MRDFLKIRRVPPALRDKIHNFYTMAARHQALQDDDVIHNLSAPLRTELVLYLYRNTLEKVPFFQVPLSMACIGCHWGGGHHHMLGRCGLMLHMSNAGWIYLQGQDPHFITALVTKLQLEYYAEGDVVVAEGDVGNTMYFVVTGTLEGRHYRARKVWASGLPLQPRHALIHPQHPGRQ